MTYKVLITCPPMLRQIDQFREKFEGLDIDITTPDVVQTLTVERADRYCSTTRWLDHRR